MNPTITVDLTEWKRVANELFRTSSRSLVDFTNGQSLKVASEAIKNTEKANRQQIEHIMGIMARTEKLRGGVQGRKGWVRITKRQIKDDSFAERIVAARFQKTGSWFGLKGKTLKEKAIRLVAAKVKSVGFIKSGWIPAVQKLSAIVYDKPRGVSGRISGAVIKGQKKGFAIPATFSLRSNIFATIGNTALQKQGKFSTWHGGKGDPMPVAQRGLQAALGIASRDMIDHLARKLKKDLARYGAK